jgi:hypothetical protein
MNSFPIIEDIIMMEVTPDNILCLQMSKGLAQLPNNLQNSPGIVILLMLPQRV